MTAAYIQNQHAYRHGLLHYHKWPYWSMLLYTYVHVCNYILVGEHYTHIITISLIQYNQYNTQQEHAIIAWMLY